LRHAALRRDAAEGERATLSGCASRRTADVAQHATSSLLHRPPFIPALRRNRGLRQLSIDEDGSDYVEYTAKDMEEVDIDDCDEDDLVCTALQEAVAVLLVRERSDPKVLAAARAGARDWQRAYRRWTTQP
jgi:hypothetical protein